MLGMVCRTKAGSGWGNSGWYTSRGSIWWGSNQLWKKTLGLREKSNIGALTVHRQNVTLHPMFMATGPRNPPNDSDCQPWPAQKNTRIVSSRSYQFGSGSLGMSIDDDWWWLMDIFKPHWSPDAILIRVSPVDFFLTYQLKGFSTILIQLYLSYLFVLFVIKLYTYCKNFNIN